MMIGMLICFFLNNHKKLLNHPHSYAPPNLIFICCASSGAVKNVTAKNRDNKSAPNVNHIKKTERFRALQN